MTLKDLSGADISRASAELDTELEQIFEEMDAVLKESQAWKTQAVVSPPPPSRADDLTLPDEYEIPGELPVSDSPVSDRLDPDFENTASIIAPAADREIFGLELEPQDPALPRVGRPSGSRPAPGLEKGPALGAHVRPYRLSPLENELPEAEILPDEFEDHQLVIKGEAAATLADMSPQALAQLIEEAVTKGVLKAFKNRGG